MVKGLLEEGQIRIIHLDFKEEVLGAKYGNSSPIKRISELEFSYGETLCIGWDPILNLNPILCLYPVIPV